MYTDYLFFLQDFFQREISPRWPDSSPWQQILYTCLGVLQRQQWSCSIADFDCTCVICRCVLVFHYGLQTSHLSKYGFQYHLNTNHAAFLKVTILSLYIISARILITREIIDNILALGSLPISSFFDIDFFNCVLMDIVIINKVDL